MDAITGFALRVSMTSRQITSDAMADPPGLSIRSTIALMELSARALRRYSTSVSEPATWPLRRVVVARAGADEADGVDDRDPLTAIQTERGGRHAAIVGLFEEVRGPFLAPAAPFDRSTLSSISSS